MNKMIELDNTIGSLLEEAPAKRITEALGVRGWSHLDAVVLAALALESPVLLIGSHGTAKSLMVERIAQALGLTLRHYNASLLNYDDLVGIPVPDEKGDGLRFAKTQGNIWDAGFVFFDEISRCRSDMQNKLFPIVHERRIIGIDLDTLQHRWAAMNPPASDVLDLSVQSEQYTGSEPLDPALADRFPFVIAVPNWGDMSRTDRLRLVMQGETADEYADLELDLPRLVEQTRATLAAVESACEEWLADYIVCLMDALEQGGLRQSPRRARLLACNVIAVHSARVVLEGTTLDDIDALEESAAQALLYGIPATCTDAPPTAVKLRAIHRQAWELASYMDDDKWREILQEPDKVRRVALAHVLGVNDEDLSKLISQALAGEPSDVRQVGIAVAMFMAFSETRDLLPATYEPLAQLADHILTPAVSRHNMTRNSANAQLLADIDRWLENRREKRVNRLEDRLLRNFMYYGFPSWWENHPDWRSAAEQFYSDLMLFGVSETSEKGE